MGPGDIIKVRDWPGTRGKRYAIKGVRDDQVDAWLVERDMANGLYTFPSEKCIIVRKAER
jgi:hypothetical protein